ncbi:MAG: HEPN domain-containing protein [Planctomycetaceae bacterium]|jgi:HEPN domain-containing protein|nr:HEPN domain-containing protein [Planctomycetaceae bacterium]
MTVTEYVEKWFEKAKSDLHCARVMSNGEQPEWYIACFHCQQAMEKALKAYLVFKDIEPPKIHNLSRLCRMCTEHDKSFAAIFEVCANMSLYLADVRYPDNELCVGETEVKSALENAQAVFDFCRSKTGSGLG